MKPSKHIAREEKSEDGQMWAQLREDYVIRRDKRNEKNTGALNDICKSNGIDLKEFNTNSYRLSKEGSEPLDYYPSSGKTYNHGTKKWGKIMSKELEQKIINHFK